MPTYIAAISGLSPLLMHRWSETNEVEQSTREIHIAQRDPRTEAERVCYRRADGSLYVPGAQFARLLRDAGAGHKQRGSRRSMRYIVPAAIIVLSDDISLLTDDGKPITDFEVDSRPVVIPATKGRIMRHRPRINRWNCEVTVEIDPTLIEPDLAHQLFVEGGRRLGIGDYRPSSGGPFGRFSVVRWGELGARMTTPAAAAKSSRRKR